jgi:cytochrome c556
MGYRSQGSPRRSSGQKFQKSQHEKAKTKARKHREKGITLQEEKPVPSPEETAQKTINSLKKLGEQKFAISPFSDYFDDWLINLKEALSEFESNPTVSVDEPFKNERERLIAKVERELAEIKQGEVASDIAAKELTDKNHLLVEIDAEYAACTREIGSRRNSEIRNLTLRVKTFEEELDRVRATKTSFFGFTKKAKAQKEAETLQKLESAKTELESSVQKFKAEQEKLHDDYEKRKQVVIGQVQRLEKEVEKMENDLSLDARFGACEALIEAVNMLLDRKMADSASATA